MARGLKASAAFELGACRRRSWPSRSSATAMAARAVGGWPGSEGSAAPGPGRPGREDTPSSHSDLVESLARHVLELKGDVADKSLGMVSPAV